MTSRNTPLTPEETAVRVRGILLIVGAVFFFAFLDTCAKFAGRNGIPAIEIAWARYSISVVFAVIALRPWRHRADYIMRRPWMQVWRALFLLGSTVLNFFAIRHLQLAETGAIMFAGTLVATALAGPLLGEWPGPRRWAAVIVGFIGVLIVIQPEPSHFNPAALYSVAASLCYAGYSLSTRVLSHTESSSSLLIYASLLATVVLTPALVPVGVWPSNWLVALALVGTGLAGGIGHWFLIASHRDAPPTVLAPFTYTQLIWMIALGFFAFGDVPGTSTLIGAALIVASGLYALYREQVRRDR